MTRAEPAAPCDAGWTATTPREQLRAHAEQHRTTIADLYATRLHGRAITTIHLTGSYL